MFKALVLRKSDEEVTGKVEELDDARLPEGDVTVAVDYSTLNYKDGLIIKNQAPLVRDYPHVPGIDLAGRVLESRHPDWHAGDAVVLTGWGVGERHWGGHAERARVKGEWLVPVPPGWTTRQTMAVGTAGFTAMLAVIALEDHGLEPFAGCIDSVGGATLARVLGQMRYRGSVAAVGLAGGSELRTTVIPFLLRGVSLLGVDSVYHSAAPRRAAWQRLGRDLDLAKLETMIVEAGLDDLPHLAEEILNGRIRGRLVVDPRR